MNCVSKGAPDRPGKQTEKQKEYTGFIENPIEVMSLLREGKGFMEKAVKYMEDKGCA